MVISVFYIELLAYKEGKTDIEFKQWDMQTCTTNDYAVRLNLSDEWFKVFKERNEKRKAEGKPARDMNNVIKRAVTEDLNSLAPAFHLEDYEL